MSSKISWSATAKKTFNDNLGYLGKEWNEKVVTDFLHRVKSVLGKIQKEPQLFPLYKIGTDIHKCIVTEQITLYYKVEGKSVKLITFWNVYQNPKRLKL